MTGSEDDTDSESRASGGKQSDREDSPVRIYHFDPDETVRSRLARTIDAGWSDVYYEGTDSLDQAREMENVGPVDDSGDDSVDVLVIEPDASADVAGLVTAADVPVALYTSLDPGDIDAAVFDEADTLVEKWTAEEGLDFVVEKILGAARSTTAPESRFTRAFRRIDPDEHLSSCVLVYADGTAIWESLPLQSLFGRRDVTVSLPETPNFYRQLTAALSHDPEAIRTIRGSDVPEEPTRFGVPTEEGLAWYRYTEHEFPEMVGPLRLIVIEDVTWSARSDARFELLELLDQHVQDGISVVDANGRIEYHNQSFADLLGYDDMVGEHAAAFRAEGELEAGQQLLQRLRTSDRQSEVIDLTLETADDAERTLATHFSVRGDEEYQGLVNVARDVSDRRDRERTLEQYQRLVESAGDPMYAVDEAGRIDICNQALADLFASSHGSLKGTPLTNLLPEAAVEGIRDALDGVTEAGESSCCEFDLETDDGEVRQFEATVAELDDVSETDDGIAGSVGIFHEVTERDRRESELDLLKQVLTRVLRHDVRTGLTVVRGQAEVLAERTSGEEQDMAETIVDRSEELVATTEKARAIERVIDSDEGRITLDLRSVVNRCVANVGAVHSEAAYDVQVTDSLPVRVHRTLPYAIENLVENAVAHCAGAASVTISATVDEECVALRIVDDGPGISAAELDVLENREETPLKHGTGVGLWLVNWVVERSGGDLTFDTGDGGTTVTVRLDAGDDDDLA